MVQNTDLHYGIIVKQYKIQRTNKKMEIIKKY